MKHQEFYTTPNKLRLYSQIWDPEVEPRAVVCLVHGLGEHSGRYAHVAASLTRVGYALLAYDLPGHGRSEGQRGHADSFESLMKDIDWILEESSRLHLGKPRFLYGHSLGALMVLNYPLRRKTELAGVIASGPGLRSPLTEQKFKLAFARVFGTLFPTYSIPTGLEAWTISRDSEVVRTYVNDPLVHGVTTLGMAKSTMPSIPWVFKHAAEFPVPLLIQQGTRDKLTYPDGAEKFASLVKGDCTLKMWEGLHHEVHNEPEKDQVIAYMIDWMDRKLAAFNKQPPAG